MAAKISSLLFLLFVLTFAGSVSAMQITIYNKGASSRVELTPEQDKKIMDILKNLYEKSDKVISINISKQDISEIKNKNRCVEIILDMSYSFNNSAIGNSIVNKILIPLSGSYANDIKKGGLSFFAGLDEYNGKQYYNSSGMNYAEQIYQELQR